MFNFISLLPKTKLYRDVKLNFCFSVLQQSNARPKTSLRPPSARPISARPAAPRMRAKTDMIVNEEIQ